MRAAADGLISIGLAAQGYTYLNIDDAWEAGWRKGPNGRNDPAAGRSANGEILTKEKFLDMKWLVDYIHSESRTSRSSVSRMLRIRMYGF